MAVKALRKYEFAPADSVDKFHGAQLLYVCWDDHLMFCSPLCYCLPPSMPFRELCEKILPKSYGYHPDWAQVDMSKATWLKSGQPFAVDMDKTLGELGLKHKDVLRFKTPGLNGLNGSGF